MIIMTGDYYDLQMSAVTTTLAPWLSVRRSTAAVEFCKAAVSAAEISRLYKDSTVVAPMPGHDHPPVLQKCNTGDRMSWIVELLDDRVAEELDALPSDMKARFRRIVELFRGTVWNTFASLTSSISRGHCGRCV
jgi:hypothetical protein